jgi:hypothetical protein
MPPMYHNGSAFNINADKAHTLPEKHSSSRVDRHSISIENIDSSQIARKKQIQRRVTSQYDITDKNRDAETDQDQDQSEKIPMFSMS